MGKIFKALEKAEKQKVASPVLQTDKEPGSDGMESEVMKEKEVSKASPAAMKHNAASPVLRIKKANRSDQVSIEAVKEQKASRDQGVSIRYSKTKVQVNDPERLRDKKIFSIFDNIETTEQIKILRTQVMRKLKEIGGNSLLVTSANPYEGKTFTSINLGVSIAKEFNRTVLIIDADLRKPTDKHTAFSTDFFSLNVEKGLTDYLAGECDIPDILINPGIDKVTLIPGGNPVYNSPELLNSSRMEEMMMEIKSRYSSRLVILDGPAVLPFPDAVILSRFVDGVLPVVEVERTSTEDVKKMMERLKDSRVIGTVLNKNKA